jgi:hypothetical protein
MHDKGAKGDQVQPKSRVSKNNEDHISQWILRQEFLGHAPSHNQIRQAVKTILKQLGDNTSLGMNWVFRFINKHSELKMKSGKIQESIRFNAFTFKAVN